jgi:hypothetical protein
LIDIASIFHKKKYFFPSLLKFLSAYGTINPKNKKSEPPGERKRKVDCRLLVQIGNRGRKRRFPPLDGLLFEWWFDACLI